MISKVVLLLMVVTMARESWCFPLGPPVGDHPEICMTMTPDHGYSGQTSAAPYTIIASGSCYNESTTLKVRLKVADADMENAYFEGFFILARAGGSDSASHGTFDDMGDEDMQPLECFSTADNGIGHSASKHYLARTFEWTAPNSDQGAITFTATVVKNLETYWSGVSLTVPYDAGCAATNDLADEAFDDLAEDQPCVSASHAVGSQEACTGCSISAQATVVFGLVAMSYKLFA